MHGHTVTVNVPGNEDLQHTYEHWEVAACVFEANVQGLVSDGFAVVEDRCGPNALAGFSPPEANELYTARRGAAGIDSVSIDAADPVAIYDGTGARLHRARELGRFDRSVIDPAWEIEHALRRAIHWPGTSNLQGFELTVSFEHDRFLAWVRADSARTLLTHLHLFGDWSHPELRALGRAFPNLRGLSLPRPWLMRSGDSELAELQYLHLERPAGESGEADLERCLKFASRRAPGLLALSVCVSGGELATVLDHPLLSRLYEVLVHVQGPFDSTPLTEAGGWHHLDRLHIQARAYDDRQRELLQRWPNVCVNDHSPSGACWQSLRRRYGP